MVAYAFLERFPHHRFGDDGTVWSKLKNRWGEGDWHKLRGSINAQGYRVYGLPDTTGRSLPQLGHRLILEAFTGIAPKGFHACHGDGVRSNNELSNLRWGTPLSNASDKAIHGTQPRGEGCYQTKLSDGQVQQIRERRRNGESLRSLAESFCVHQSCISKIANHIQRKEVACGSST